MVTYDKDEAPDLSTQETYFWFWMTLAFALGMVSSMLFYWLMSQ